MSAETFTAMLGIPGLRGVVLETYGAGNAPTADWFIDAVSAAVARGVVVLNVTQCLGGSVSMEMYETGKRLGQTGVISGRDITTESAVTKMMVVLGASDDPQEVRRGLEADRCGEISDWIRSVCGVGACWYAAERYFGGLWRCRRRDRRENRRRFFGTKIILYLAALSGRDPFDAALRPGLSPGDRVWEATFWRNVRVV